MTEGRGDLLLIASAAVGVATLLAPVAALGVLAHLLAKRRGRGG